ncbi:SMALL AUXIN UPREGULATED RNA 42 [Hibiscus trionum]|uniref:SMALL AUXIN UPREGULATED RNA 42 n=1 Tax=Hibiscus trionum TaxID=183268 RepID=A0A9W7M1D5_HIBTR|nr:SMALL AUXIN UPREGULATED RNA 42 [Hibiscus trionum]
MAKLRMTNKDKEKKKGIVKLKHMAEMLQKSLSLSLGKKWKQEQSSALVPQGHFAVVAGCGEEPRRFVVPLSYLTHPGFLLLLEQAAEEYGFERKGALTIPCTPTQLERVLADSIATLTWPSPSYDPNLLKPLSIA